MNDTTSNQPEDQTTSSGSPSQSCSSSLRRSGRVISWFSCGAASAVATKLAIEKYGTVEIYYTDTGSEHEDNPRFLADCEKWFGQEITILKSDKFANVWEVFEKARFLSSPYGAPCTGAMKKDPANGIWRVGDVEIFGYTSDEQHRVERWQANNTERIIECPLIDKHLDKSDCLGMLDRVGIKLPEMYALGFRNNNCRGCVKAQSIDYWKRTRLHFPDVFERMAKLEREFDHAINRVTVKGERVKVFLDEIPQGDPTGADPKISCGLFCMSESDSFSKP
jgi:3'-phosphoadenosine 5'-phosphosulfate sulfotransferase (PAPS reductase)/FAD synthetase